MPPICHREMPLGDGHETGGALCRHAAQWLDEIVAEGLGRHALARARRGADGQVSRQTRRRLCRAMRRIQPRLPAPARRLCLDIQAASLGAQVLGEAHKQLAYGAVLDEMLAQLLALSATGREAIASAGFPSETDESEDD